MVFVLYHEFAYLCPVALLDDRKNILPIWPVALRDILLEISVLFLYGNSK